MATDLGLTTRAHYLHSRLQPADHGGRGDIGESVADLFDFYQPQYIRGSDAEEFTASDSAYRQHTFRGVIVPRDSRQHLAGQ